MILKAIVETDRILLGRYDADYGSLLIHKGRGEYRREVLSGDLLRGQARHILPIRIADEDYFIVAMNNSSLRLVKISD